MVFLFNKKRFVIYFFNALFSFILFRYCFFDNSAHFITEISFCSLHVYCTKSSSSTDCNETMSVQIKVVIDGYLLCNRDERKKYGFQLFPDKNDKFKIDESIYFHNNLKTFCKLYNNIMPRREFNYPNNVNREDMNNALAAQVHSNGCILKGGCLQIFFCANNIDSLIIFQSCFGGLLTGRSDHTIVLRFYDKEKLIQLMKILHNRLRHPNKISQYNEHWAHLPGFIKATRNQNPIDSSYFVHFLCDGSVCIRKRIRTRQPSKVQYFSYSVQIEFTQNKVAVKILEEMKDILEGSRLYYDVNKKIGGTSCKLETGTISSTQKAVEICLDAFKKNTFFGIKASQFEPFEEAFTIIVSSKHLEDDGRKKLELLKTRLSELKLARYTNNIMFPKIFKIVMEKRV